MMLTATQDRAQITLGERVFTDPARANLPGDGHGRSLSKIQPRGPNDH